jgi:DNA-binding transcriptional MerR regulator
MAVEKAIQDKLLRVGEVARLTGKTVRAIHLYEELGLLAPASRSSGGFRLYRTDAVGRVEWITKLQEIGFSLAEIQGFVRDFENAASGRTAATRVREVFRSKLAEVREQVRRLQEIEKDLEAAVQYLESCSSCSTEYTPVECRICEHQGHELGTAPELFSPLASAAPANTAPHDGAFHVHITKLRRDSGDAG